LERRDWWMAGIAAVGLVIGAIALVIAIDAKNDTASDVKVTAAVNQQARAAVQKVRHSLDGDVKRATVALRSLDDSSANADKARARLRREVKANQGGVAGNRQAIASNRQAIAALERDVKALQTSVGDLTTQVNQQGKQLNRLASRVSKLEGEVP
jgi:chromosome segregation ATPase